MVGTIIGIYSAKDLAPEMPLPLMGDEYPDWNDGLLVQVKYDKPQRPVSLEEFVKIAAQYPEFENYSQEDFEMAYQNSVRVTKMGVYPMEDLECF